MDNTTSTHISTEPMADPYTASKWRDAFYWQKRAEDAEAELARLRKHVEDMRACTDAVLQLRYALAQFDGADDGR